MRVGVLTISDGCHAGVREDLSGQVILDWCLDQGFQVVCRGLVPDDTSHIVPLLLEWADREGVNLLLTTGGTGFGPRDVTPEATAAVLDRVGHGLAERIRRQGEAKTRFAALSRGLVGSRGECLVVNLPGSPGGVRDGLHALDGLVQHTVRLLAGETAHDAPGQPADEEQERTPL